MAETLSRRTFIASSVAAGATAALLSTTPLSAYQIVPTTMPGPDGFVLEKLSYSYSALEPVIDAMTMEIHHSKHHKAYIDNLNKAIAGTEMEGKSLESIIGKKPEKLPVAVRNNGGGHANHLLFWKIMKPDGGGDPSGELLTGIVKAFGSVAEFRAKFESEAKSRFGSGWAFLAVDKDAKLHCYSLPNQDSPWMQGHFPIMGLDVWEHAYYLKYQNKRADYVANWWKVVDWKAVGELYNTTQIRI